MQGQDGDRIMQLQAMAQQGFAAYEADGSFAPQSSARPSSHSRHAANPAAAANAKRVASNLSWSLTAQLEGDYRDTHDNDARA